MSTIDLPLIIEPEDLSPYLHNDKIKSGDLLIIDLSSNESYAAGHIPGAIHIAPQHIVAGTPPAPGKLPGIDRLQQLFSQLGLTPNTHVVAYDDEGGGWAGRFLWTLDCINHSTYSYLNGGIWAWRSASMPLSQKPLKDELSDITPSQLELQLNKSALIEKEDIIKKLGAPNFLVWDARSREEYDGSRTTAQKNGHIPGAVHCEWTELMDQNRDLRIRTDVTDYLSSKGITSEKELVTHCQSHHRSGLTYLVGKSLGFNIRAYPGSWSEWGNSGETPVETHSD